MPVWTTEQKCRLLLACIVASNSPPPKWDDVTKLMGPEYTSESVRQQYQKLKKNHMSELAIDDNAEVSVPKTSTPRKRKTPVKPVMNEEIPNDEECENMPETPSKKLKIKLEDSNEDD